MQRIKNQNDFIAKANEIYNERYDYSLVEYVRSSEKVKIICPEHGVYEKSPNKHLQGQGCPVCGRNRTKLGKDDFIRKAKSVHGDKYDYSLVVYEANNKKVKIMCPLHGLFLQAPHEHIILKHGCPMCGHKQAGELRKGLKNVAHRQDVKQKRSDTCMTRFGTKTWAESDVGRKRLHDIIVNDGKLDVMKATCKERYGTDFWTQSDEGREQLRCIMSSDDTQERVRNGYQSHYGMHYMQTEEGRLKAKSYIDDERREKMKQSMIEKYGVPYSVMNATVQAKAWRTKRINGTFNTSKPEKTLYKILCDIFGEEDVMPQYVDEQRYPFHCDFYIKSLDLFIELNAHWSHGGHWFDETNIDDLKHLKKWQDKSEQKGSKYYYQAIDVWTHRDLMKKQVAEDNNLNYVVFWNQDLSDAREYLSMVTHSEVIK